MLAAVVLLGAAAWVFIELADEVIEGEAIPFDEALLLVLRAPDDPSALWGPVWLNEAVRDITALGGYTLLSIITLATVAYLWLARQRREAVFVLASAAGAVLWIVLLKAGFDRPRPDLVPHGVAVHSASFPSGHASASAAIFLTLGALLARFQHRRRLRVFFIGLAVFLTLLVGVSRVYLGVHWPSDIVAGWTLGGGWALLCWLVASWLEARHVLPAEGDQEDSSAGSKASSSDP